MTVWKKKKEEKFKYIEIHTQYDLFITRFKTSCQIVKDGDGFSH